MNHGADPQPSSPSWRQVVIQFDNYPTAEHTGIASLGPAMISAEAAGLIASWFFLRKAPCWRLRFQPARANTDQDALTFVSQQLDTLHGTDRIAHWVETIYEPETHAFGGTAAMDVAHHLFHHDSRHILTYLSSPSATSGGRDERRELSILLCGVLMRAAGQDWYEQGDIWARIAEHRTLPASAPLDRLHAMASQLRQLMTTDTNPDSPWLRENGSLTILPDWSAGFAEAGHALNDLARNGTLSRGVRAILTHHILFHWNRLGIPHSTQSILANAAKAVVLEP